MPLHRTQPAIKVEHTVVSIPVGGEEDGGVGDFCWGSKAFEGDLIPEILSYAGFYGCEGDAVLG